MVLTLIPMWLDMASVVLILRGSLSDKYPIYQFNSFQSIAEGRLHSRMPSFQMGRAISGTSRGEGAREFVSGCVRDFA